MGALDYMADDATDGTEDYGVPGVDPTESPLAGTSRGALQKYIDAAGDTSDMRSALDRVAQALKTDRKANSIQALFSAAAALGAPTRTGSIGETASNLGKSLSETLATQNAQDRQGAAAAAKLQLDEAKAELTSRRALGVQAMKAMGAQSPMQKEMGKIILGAPDSFGRQSAYRKVPDPANPGQLTYQFIKILQPGESLPGMPTASTAAPPKPAYMPVESDINPETGKIIEPPAAPTSAGAAGGDGTSPLRPVQGDLPPQVSVTGKPADLEKTYGLKARGIDLSATDQDAPVVLNLATGDWKPAPGIDPLAKYGELTGAPLMERLRAEDPRRAAEVQSIIDGRLLAPTTGARAKDADTLLKLATAIDPTFDASVGKTRFKTRNDFSPGGVNGRVMASIDTVVNHMGKYAKGVEDVNNTAIPGINTVKNALVQATGHASPTNIKTESNAVANELMKAFRGTAAAGSTKDIEEWRKSVDENASPDQQKGSIETGLDLLYGRLNPLVNQWNTTMGEHRSVLSFISPKSRDTLMKLDPNLALTDDDRAFLASEELAKRHKGAAALAATTDKLKGATTPEAPAAPKPAPVALPADMKPSQAIAQARAAVVGGKDPVKVAERLRSFGLPEADVKTFEAWAARR